MNALTGVVEFLRDIGLAVRIAPERGGFAPFVRIDRGTLIVDPRAQPSTLLHEACHVAITPHGYRSWMSGNIDAGQRRMLAAVTALDLWPDHPLWRAAIQCSDPEATAWAWAAGTHLGLPAVGIILDEEYDGTGSSVRQLLSLRAYAGINGLVHAGMLSGLREFPRLLRWTQDAGYQHATGVAA